MDYFESEELLTFFLSRLANTNDNIELLNQLKNRNLLARNFEDRYIVNNNIKRFSPITKKEVQKDVETYFFTADDGLPLRVELNRTKDGWKLKSYSFQCQGCFGLDMQCNVCGGSGWGVL